MAIVVNAFRGKEVAPQRVMAEYRMQLFGSAESEGEGEDGKPIRRGLREERVREVLEKGKVLI